MWLNINIGNLGKINQEIFDYFYNYSVSLKVCQNKLEKRLHQERRNINLI